MPESPALTLESTVRTRGKAQRRTHIVPCDMAQACRKVEKDERHREKMEGYEPEIDRFAVVDTWIQDRLYVLALKAHKRCPSIPMLTSDGKVTSAFISELVGPLKKETLITNVQLRALATLIQSGYPDSYCRDSTIELYVRDMFRPKEAANVEADNIEIDVEYEDIMLTLQTPVSLAMAIAAVNKIGQD